MHHAHRHPHRHAKEGVPNALRPGSGIDGCVCPLPESRFEDTSGPRLLWTLVLNSVIPAVQLAGGVMTGSMALISDAIHNFSDFTAVLISYIAYRIGRQGASLRNTFGNRRAEVIAALVNGVLLTGAAIFIIYHALERFAHPEKVSGAIVMIIAGIGVVGNGLSAALLHRDAQHSLNVRGAFLHMLADLFTSVAVLLTGLVLCFKPWYWMDPLISILIVLFILKNCWSMVKEAGGVLMNATPRGLEVEQVKRSLEAMEGINSVHYLHVWNLSATSIGFSCHVVVDEQPLSRTEKLAAKIREELWRRFGIDHPTLQFETAACGQGGLLCEFVCNGDNGLQAHSASTP